MEPAFETTLPESTWKQWLGSLTATREQRSLGVFLIADLAVFITLLVTYFYLRASAGPWPMLFHFPSGLMAASMTMFALSTSVTVTVAEFSAMRNDWPLTTRWTAITMGGWLVFLFLELMEWARLIWLENVTLRSPFGATFYTITGFYAVHVIFALSILAASFTGSRRAKLGVAALFLHFLNLVWLLLWPTLYWLSTDLKEL